MPKKLNADATGRDKLLALYQSFLLNGPRKHFQDDLADKLECSPQTISRLVEKVEAHLGKDAYIERGLEGRRRYYRLVSPSQEKALGFSREELHFLATCRDLAAPFLPKAVGERIERTLTSLALSLGEPSLSGQPIGFRSKGSIDYTPHLEKLRTLRQAIAARQICRVLYKANGRGAAAAYRYAPGRIIAMGGTLYVQGYRLEEGGMLRDRPTTFSLHRIESVQGMGEYFTFNAADDDAQRFGLSWHEPRQMQIYVASSAADYVRDRTWSYDQTIEEHLDGSLTLTVTTTSEKELNAWAWSFGETARVLTVQP
jgi:predicted DNA-binding transcriptional regulator YafY